MVLLNTKQQRAFKGIWIPAEIWLNENLTMTEKIVYAEIDSFCSNTQECFAGNKHFAQLIGISENRISHIIASLEKKGYVKRHIIYKQGSKEIEKRLLQTTIGYCRQKQGGIVANNNGGIVKNNKDISTSVTNTITNTDSIENVSADTPPKRNKFIPPTLEEVAKYIAEKKLGVNPQKFFDYYDAGDWHDAKGKAVKNWKQKCITWDKHDNNGGVTKQEPAPCFESDFIIG
jgi:DNA-binding MarR family transcriptional regulator